MVDNNDEPKIATWKQVTAFISLLSVMPIMFAINGQYVDWHDGRYPLRQEVILLAEATILRQTAETAQKTAAENSEKLDFLVKSEAAKNVRSIQQEIALHKAANDGSALWRRELIEMEGRLQRAENYKDCVVSHQGDCDAERIW